MIYIVHIEESQPIGKRCMIHRQEKTYSRKKMAYPNEDAALEAIKLWKIEHIEDTKEMAAYQCSHCHKWHIGHYTNNVHNTPICAQTAC